MPEKTKKPEKDAVPPEEPKEEKKPAETESKPEAPKSAAGKVNYVYSALLLHSAGREITEDSMKRVVEATGVKPDPAQIKALVANLEGVNIEEAIQQAAAPVSAPSGGEAKKEEPEKKEEEKKKTEEAAAGLSSLFG